jgi:hypothetical protein
LRPELCDLELHIHNIVSFGSLFRSFLVVCFLNRISPGWGSRFSLYISAVRTGLIVLVEAVSILGCLLNLFGFPDLNVRSRNVCFEVRYR